MHSSVFYLRFGFLTSYHLSFEVTSSHLWILGGTKSSDKIGFFNLFLGLKEIGVLC